MDIAQRHKLYIHYSGIPGIPALPGHGGGVAPCAKLLGPIQAANRDPALARNPPRRRESELAVLALPPPPLMPLPLAAAGAVSPQDFLSSWMVPEFALLILPKIFLRPFGFVAIGGCC